MKRRTRISPTSSRRSALPIPGSERRLAEPALRQGEPLRLRRLPGRWRGRRHGLVGLLVAWSGWAWLGYDGALLLVLWWWSRHPRPVDGIWLIEPARVRAMRAGYWRTRLMLRGGAPLEIFHDELPAADLARLRRLLKRQLAAG